MHTTRHQIRLASFVITATAILAAIYIALHRDASIDIEDTGLGKLTSGFEHRQLLYVYNGSDDELNIEQLLPSCSCTEMEIKSSKLRTGKSLLAQVTVVPPHPSITSEGTTRSSEFMVDLLLRGRWSSSGNEVQRSFSLSGNVEPAFLLSNPSPCLDVDLDKPSGLSELTLSTALADDVETLNVVDFSSNLHCVVQNCNVKTRTCNISITPIRDCLLGEDCESYITIAPQRIDGAIGRELKIPVKLNVKSPFTWFPHSIAKGVVRLSDSINEKIEISRTDNADLEIRDVTIHPPNASFQVKFEPHKNSSGCVRVNGTANATGNGKVVVKCKVISKSGIESISIPIHYYVLN